MESHALPDHDLRHDMVGIVNAIDRLRTRVLVPRESLQIVAPSTWAPDAVTVYGLPIIRSDGVERPEVVIDPWALWH